MDQELAYFDFKKPSTPDLTFRCRSWLFGSEIVWRLGADALSCDHPPNWRIALGDIRRISLFGVPGMRYLGNTFTPAGMACRVKANDGRSAMLSSTHVIGMGRYENRSAAYQPFVDALLHRAAAINPKLVIRMGWPPYLWWLWIAMLVGYIGLVLFAFGGVIFATRMIGGGLWSGDHSEITFTNVTEGIMFLIATVTFGCAIPGIMRVIKRERPKTVRASEMFGPH